MDILYVERKPGVDITAQEILSEARDFLGIAGTTSVRYFNRYVVDGVSNAIFDKAVERVFSEKQTDLSYSGEQFHNLAAGFGEHKIVAWEYLPGQFDARSDSAIQCLSLLGAEEAKVKCSKVAVFFGKISSDELSRAKKYLINTVDSQEISIDDELRFENLTTQEIAEQKDIAIVEGFNSLGADDVGHFQKEWGLAMDCADILTVQEYFRKEGREPTVTEIRVLDTYWSDHCRHTTFLTHLDDISIEDAFDNESAIYKEEIKSSLEAYQNIRKEVYGEDEGENHPLTLMDAAIIGAKVQKRRGNLSDLEESAENNAYSLVRKVSTKSGLQDYLVMFKNETHNHPTEIEPFGGAATCIGGAIRDPLSGRAYVYQSMRVTGAADPTASVSTTLEGKLPQKKICTEAAAGFSSYGNQVGLATGQVAEYYHPYFVAKRLELGAVIAAVPMKNVRRDEPIAGDVVIMLGGGTGRDGIGGATGSSKVHTQRSVTTLSSEVQKGNAPEERKIQRLFRKYEVARLIKRSNDFGAGGVSVAIGELAAGLEIDLDKVPKKYAGLDGTELAISESQERMAVVVAAEDVQKFIDEATKENLVAVAVAIVTDNKRLVIKWRGKTIVNISRDFLDTAGAIHHASALIKLPRGKSPLDYPLDSAKKVDSFKEKWLTTIGSLECASQRGLVERFDSTIGAATVLFPFGGKTQATPECAMVARIPTIDEAGNLDISKTVSIMAHGFDPRVAAWSSYHGAQVAVISALAKVVAVGGSVSGARLSFQEFFGRARDAATFGYPLAALLGGLCASLGCASASIGGKDSMSGTFSTQDKTIDVPHTLVCFAVATCNENQITSGAFKKAGNKIYLLKTPYTRAKCPRTDVFLKNCDALEKLNRMGAVRAMYAIGAGGICEAISKMALGNEIGAIIHGVDSDAIFLPLYGSFIIESAIEIDAAAFVDGTLSEIGETCEDKTISIKNGGAAVEISLDDIRSFFERTLAKVYPVASFVEKEGLQKNIAGIKGNNCGLFGGKYDGKKACFGQKKPGDESYQNNTLHSPAKIGGGGVNVVIPVFYGTNCEYDIERAFKRAGAKVNQVIIRNKNRGELLESLSELARRIDDAQILSLVGGFSAADEPDGSAKFIANCLRSAAVSDAIMRLLSKKNLILGICNGFQALVKTGLVVYGKFTDATDDSPTLTFNTIGRHISYVARTKVCKYGNFFVKTPWAQDASVTDGKTHLVAISHGEGRFQCSASVANSLFASGQVFTQYVDIDGTPAADAPSNPNGSVCAIEGIISPDGLILGKMGHNERSLDAGLLRNIVQDKESLVEDIFGAGVRYFE